MRTRVQKWGHSLAVRIPKAMALEAQIGKDALVDMSLVDGVLQVAPVTEPAFTLESLLEAITDENVHAEADTGGRQGVEEW